MASKKIIVQEGQSWYDIALQEFGTLENIFSIFVSNPNLDINTPPAPLAALTIDADGIGDEIIKIAYTRDKYVTSNADSDFVAADGNYLFQNGDDFIFMDGLGYEFN